MIQVRETLLYDLQNQLYYVLQKYNASEDNIKLTFWQAFVCKIPLLVRALGLKAEAARPSARATIGYLVYKASLRAGKTLFWSTMYTRPLVARPRLSHAFRPSARDGIVHTAHLSSIKCLIIIPTNKKGRNYNMPRSVFTLSQSDGTKF